MSEIVRFLPWQQQIAADWLSNTDRFAHAWLIHGRPGIGKRQFALAAAASLLCEQPQGAMACGVCQACRWVAAGNHPDFRRVRPEALALEEGDAPEESASQAKKTPSREIRIEQLRALSGWFGTATHRGGWKVAVIYPAHAMNVFTANALLKVLEEPPPRTVFLLTVDAPDRVPATIVSRCRRLPLPVPPAEQAVGWLKEQGVTAPGEWLSAAGAAPLRALELSRSGDLPCPAWLQAFLQGIAGGDAAPAQDPVLAAADALSGGEAAAWIDVLQRAFVDLSLVAVGAAPRYFPAQADLFAKVARVASPVTLAEAQKFLSRQRAVAGHPLSQGLFIHNVLQRCAQACMPVAVPGNA